MNFAEQKYSILSGYVDLRDLLQILNYTSFLHFKNLKLQIEWETDPAKCITQPTRPASITIKKPTLIIVKADTVKFLSPGTLPRTTGRTTKAPKTIKDCHSGGGNIFQVYPIIAGINSTTTATNPDIRTCSTPWIRLRLNQI